MKFLQKGDYIDLVNPTCYLSDAQIDKIVNYVEGTLQLNIVNKQSLYQYDRHLYFRGTDEERAKQLMDAVSNDKSSCIWQLAEGYGANRVVDYITANKLDKRCQNHPYKTLLGFGSATVLQLFLHNNFNYGAVSTPLLQQLAENKVSQDSVKMMEDVIFGKTKTLEYKLTPLYSPAGYSVSNSEIVGGSIEWLTASLANTGWEIRADNKILFCEARGEKAYRIDRMLYHLLSAGILDKVECIVIGNAMNPNLDKIDFYEMYLELFGKDHGIPVFYNPNIGHGKINNTLPFNMPSSIREGKNGEYSLTVSVV